MRIYYCETNIRSWVKSLVWRLLGFLILGLISWAMTGSWKETLGITSAFNIIRFILYYFHERLWLRVKWGQKIVENH